MTIFGPEGLTIPTMDEILENLKARFKSAFGDEIRVEDVDGVLGRIATILAEVKNDVLADLSATNNALLPSKSIGTLLEELVKFNGITRNIATHSTVILTVTANAAGCTIEDGDLVATGTGIVFEIEGPIVLAPDEVRDNVQATAVDEGALEAPAGTITTIITPRYGWASVTNALDAELGNAKETDPALRIRRWDAAVAVGIHSPSAIHKAIADLDDVTDVFVEYNNSTTTNENGVPPQHIRTVVIGGDDQDIADTLFGVSDADGNPPSGSIAAGIGSWGDEDVAVEDTETGQTDTMHFQRGELIPIYIIVKTTKKFGTYPQNGDEQMKQLIVDFFEGNLEVNDVSVDPFHLGDDVVSSRIYTPCNAVLGHSVREIWISRTDPPTSADDVPMAVHEKAITDVSKITVEHVA